jgi:hypothetical protein
VCEIEVPEPPHCRETIAHSSAISDICTKTDRSQISWMTYTVQCEVITVECPKL